MLVAGGQTRWIPLPAQYTVNDNMIVHPSTYPDQVEIVRGPNIKPFPVNTAIAGDIAGKALSANDMGLLDLYAQRVRDEIQPLYTPYRVSNFLLRLSINRFLRFVSRSARARRDLSISYDGLGEVSMRLGDLKVARA